VVHHQAIEVSRGNGVLLPGASDPLPVGKLEDFAIKRLEREAAEEARLAKIKQDQARSMTKRGKGLGRHEHAI